MFDPSLFVGIRTNQIQIQLSKISHAMLFCYILDKDKEQAARRFRIIVGHMVVFQGNPKPLGQGAQTMTLVLWIKVPSKL